MYRNRAVVVFAVFLMWICLPGASSIAQPVEKVLNWTAPPYWMPAAALPEKPTNEPPDAQISPEAAAAVPTAPLAFTGITPCRVADTRGNGFSGQFGPPKITPAGRTITIVNTCGIPTAAQAVSFNFSAVNVPGAGFLVAYPAGGAFPSSATMTYNQNTPTISNAAVVPLGTAGAISVVAGVVSVDVVIDVNGYYAPQTVVNSLNGLTGDVSLSPGANISIQTVGGPLFISAPGVWSLSGNTVSPGQFLGTTNAQPLEIRVNNKRMLRIEPGVESPNLLGGYTGNASSANVSGATIGGGGDVFYQNHVADLFGTVGGGRGNLAGSEDGLTGSAYYSTVAGGERNTAGGGHSSVGGGEQNLASGITSTVGGGYGNIATGVFTTVPGGTLNSAIGNYSFAAGRRARSTHAGTFVWGDSTDADVSSFGANSFVVRAVGGARFYSNTALSAGVGLAAGGGAWSNLSDAGLKENRRSVDGRGVLQKLSTIPIDTWNYASQSPSIRHVGPTAQDFHAAFGVGEDDRHITTVDADGVALAAIQALYELVKEKDSRIQALEERLVALEKSKTTDR